MRNKLINIGFYNNIIEQLKNIVFKYPILFLFLFATINFLFSVAITDFRNIYIYDPFYYLIKAIEISDGNWIPDKTSFMGWSIIQAFFIKILFIESVDNAILLSKILSSVIMALVIIPLYKISKYILDIKHALYVVFLFSLSPIIISISGNAMTEPLFIFLVVYSIYFLIKSKDDIKNILYSSVFAVLAYYVRPNGLFLLLILYFLLFLKKTKTTSLYLFIALIIFLLLNIPHYLLRVEYCGAFFDYGPNSKYFVNSYSDVWNEYVKNPTLVEFLKKSSFSQIFNKYVHNGFYLIITDTMHYIINKIFVLPFVLGAMYFLFIQKQYRMNVVLLTIFILMFALIPVYHVFGSERHLIVNFPFMLIIIVGFLVIIFKPITYNNFLHAIIILIVILNSPISLAFSNVKSGHFFSKTKFSNEFIDFANNNFLNNILIISSREALEFVKCDNILKNKNSKFKIIDKEVFDSTDLAYDNYVKNEIEYILLNKNDTLKYNFLKGVFNDKNKFEKVIEFNNHLNINWSFPNLEIFKIKKELHLNGFYFKLFRFNGIYMRYFFKIFATRPKILC